MGPKTRCFPYQWVQLQTYESRTLFLMTSLQYYCILGLAEIKTASRRQNYAQKMQDEQVTKSLKVQAFFSEKSHVAYQIKGNWA